MKIHLTFVPFATTRHCALCAHEFGIVMRGASHGVCKRHSLESFNQIRDCLPTDQFELNIKEINEANELTDPRFCFDMSQLYDG